MRLDSLIILRIGWNSYVFVLRGKQWKYGRIELYNLCCVVLCCVVLCVVSCVLCVRPSSSSPVVVRRRRRPSSSSSVRPSVPSVRRRRRQAANPRPHANFRKNFKRWVLQPRDYEIRIELDPEIFLAWPEIAVRVEKVGFTAETRLL